MGMTFHWHWTSLSKVWHNAVPYEPEGTSNMRDINTSKIPMVMMIKSCFMDRLSMLSTFDITAYIAIRWNTYLDYPEFALSKDCRSDPCDISLGDCRYKFISMRDRHTGIRIWTLTVMRIQAMWHEPQFLCDLKLER